MLKCLNVYLRVSTDQTLLSALAFLHINYDVNIDVEKVIEVFAEKKAMVLRFVNIINI